MFDSERDYHDSMARAMILFASESFTKKILLFKFFPMIMPVAPLFFSALALLCPIIFPIQVIFHSSYGG